MEDLRYPIGKFDWSLKVKPEDIKTSIESIEAAPLELRKAVQNFQPHQLDTPYRPGGWTVRQVVHHLPDSHLNSYVRFKLALTEEKPTIKPYKEDLWAELNDARTSDIDVSLKLLESLHRRWILFLRSMTEADFKRTFLHPDLGEVPLDKTLCMYAWHGRHHTAQITSLSKRMGW